MRTTFSTILAVVLISAAAAVTRGQEAANLGGAIKAPAGAAVPGATVTVTSRSTAAERTTVTNEHGFFSCPQIKAGVYRIVGSQSGLKTAAADSGEMGV